MSEGTEDEVHSVEQESTLDATSNIGDDVDEATSANGDDVGTVAAAVSWRVAKSLLVLRAQINHKAPQRKKTHDGTVGDAAHQSRKSDHNPWVRDGGAGVVTALDVTHDPAGACDCKTLASALVAARDTRLKYIIWDSRICRSYAADGVPPWQWGTYGGANAHNKHIHISVSADAALYDSQAAWQI